MPALRGHERAARRALQLPASVGNGGAVGAGAAVERGRCVMIRVDANPVDRTDRFEVRVGGIYQRTREPMHAAAEILSAAGEDWRAEMQLFVDGKPSLRGAVWEHLGWRSREGDAHGPRTVQVQRPREFPR
jgi:hypothetical protein